MVAGLVIGPVGVDEDDVQVRLDEGQIVVAAVPDDQVGFVFSAVKDGVIVDSSKHRYVHLK